MRALALFPAGREVNAPTYFPQILRRTGRKHTRSKKDRSDCRVAQSFRGPSFGSSGAGARAAGVCVWSDRSEACADICSTGVDISSAGRGGGRLPDNSRFRRVKRSKDGRGGGVGGVIVSAKIIYDYQRPIIIIRLRSFRRLFQCSLPLLSRVVLRIGFRKHGVGNLEVTMLWAVIACRVAGSWEFLR
jgi:hypothetical protein